VALLGARSRAVDLRAELDLLDDRLRLFLARIPRLDAGLVLELAGSPMTYRPGAGGRGNLDKIEVGLLREPQRLVME